MFIVELTYKVELEKIDQFLDEHIDFLNKQYALGNFIASGRKVPRVGGVILSTIDNKGELENIIKQDPFNKNNLATYKYIEFLPSKTCPELSFLLDQPPTD